MFVQLVFYRPSLWTSSVRTTRGWLRYPRGCWKRRKPASRLSTRGSPTPQLCSSPTEPTNPPCKVRIPTHTPKTLETTLRQVECSSWPTAEPSAQRILRWRAVTTMFATSKPLAKLFAAARTLRWSPLPCAPFSEGFLYEPIYEWVRQWYWQPELVLKWLCVCVFVKCVEVCYPEKRFVWRIGCSKLKLLKVKDEHIGWN